VTGRPEIMCTRKNFLGPLVPKINGPGNSISLDWYIPIIMHYSIHIQYVIHYDRDVSMQEHFVSGRIHFGDQGSQVQFKRGHIVSGGPITPPEDCMLLD
jgi:hypothetical protein